MIPERRATESQAQAQQALCSQYPRTGRAFRMVQQLDDLYACPTLEEAAAKLRALISWMMHIRLEPMKQAAQSLRERAAEILEYFRHQPANAFAEGMNSLIQADKRGAQGFRTYKGYHTMIFLVVGRLKLSCPIPFPVLLFTEISKRSLKLWSRQIISQKITGSKISMMIIEPISEWLLERDGSRFLSAIGLSISAFGLIGLMLEMYSE